MRKVTVFAPATVALSGTLLDSFGFPLEGIGDIVHAEYTDDFEGVQLVDIKNDPGLPWGPKNVVEAVGKRIYDLATEDEFFDEMKKWKGIKLILDKQMKIGTGMGSSAASGVAAAVAVNELLGQPYKTHSSELLQSVVYGEFVACGAAHSGNAIPCLLGGPVFIFDSKSLEHKKIPTPSFWIVIVSPDLSVETREARRLLWESPYNIPLLITRTQMLLKKYFDKKPPFKLTEKEYAGIVKKGGSQENVRDYLTGALEVMYGFLTDNSSGVGKGLEKDKIVTACRATLIRSFTEVKKAALIAGATAFCISGSGPAVFGLAASRKQAEKIGHAMMDAFAKYKIASRSFTSQISEKGAQVLSFE